MSPSEYGETVERSSTSDLAANGPYLDLPSTVKQANAKQKTNQKENYDSQHWVTKHSDIPDDIEVLVRTGG